MFSPVQTFLRRVRSFFRRRSMDREMAEELEFHQEMLRSKYLREGLPATVADGAARKSFGNATRWHERLREVWQFRTLEDFTRDLKYSARLLRKSPGFMAVALGTLALGVGANTAVFSLINGLLLRPLPVPESDRLVVLNYEDSVPHLSYKDGMPQAQYTFCTPFFRGLEKQHDIFSNVFAFNPDTLQVRGSSGNENARGVLVSGQYFRALEVPPLKGRYLTPEDDRPGGSPEGWAVVISEGFWKRWFDGAPDVVGRKLVIANTPFTVVGVMPKRFTGASPVEHPEIYVPFEADPVVDAPRDHINAGTHAWWISVMARLKPGITLEQTNTALKAVSGAILHESTDDARYIQNEEKGTLLLRGGAGIEWVCVCAVSISQTVGDDVRDVWRDSTAGVPEPRQSAAGAWSGS